MNIEDLLEELDGGGIIVVDMDAVENTLKVLGFDLDSEVVNYDDTDNGYEA
jgi:hypothetical protein